MELCGIIKSKRKALRLSQVDLSRRSGVPQSTISAIETGARIPTAETLVLLAKGLFCSVNDLLSVDPQNKKQPTVQDGELLADVISRIQDLPDPALFRVSDFLDGLQAGREIAAAAPAPTDPDDSPAQ